MDEDHVNPIDRDCVDRSFQIIYEEHYQRYKEEFGTVIQGFFSDEPRFGNAASITCIRETGRNMGELLRQFSLSRRLPELLEEEWGRYRKTASRIFGAGNPVMRRM